MRALRLPLRVLRFVFVRCPGAFLALIGRNLNLFFVLVALISAAVLAGVTGHWLFYRGAYILGALIPLCFIWARVNAGGLEVEVERATDRLQVGQEAETRLRLKSRSIFTKLWLEIEDKTDMPGPPPKTVITLPSKGARNWKVTMRCRRRGLYAAGPVTVTTGDPFGLFKVRRSYGVKQRLLVLPQPQDLPYFWAPAAMLPGEGTVRQRTHYVTPNAAAIREYYPGDSFSRIHWKSTARLERLMVKTFEMDPTSNIWIVLDLHAGVQRGEGDESTEEYGVRVAASLANHFLQANRMCGLMASGAEETIIDPARGADQLSRMLETLATAEASGQKPLARLLQEEGQRAGRHTTVIIVTPSLDEEWALTLGTLLHSGARAAVVQLDPGTFGDGDEGELPLGQLAAMGVVSYVVPAESDISIMLGPAGVRGDSLLEREPVGAA
jgi:uncharacterized protein (DUF58 family)